MERDYTGERRRRDIPWPSVLTEPEGAVWHHDSWSWGILVLMAPATRDAVNQLYHAIHAAAAGTFLDGKRQGLSVLQGLASGDVSLGDFDEALLTPAERQAAGRR